MFQFESFRDVRQFTVIYLNLRIQFFYWKLKMKIDDFKATHLNKNLKIVRSVGILTTMLHCSTFNKLQILYSHLPLSKSMLKT